LPQSVLFWSPEPSPSVLDMAGYSDEAAPGVMEMRADIEDAEIQKYHTLTDA